MIAFAALRVPVPTATHPIRGRAGATPTVQSARSTPRRTAADLLGRMTVRRTTLPDRSVAAVVLAVTATTLALCFLGLLLLRLDPLVGAGQASLPLGRAPPLG